MKNKGINRFFGGLIVLILTLTGSLSAQRYVFRVYRQPEGLKNLAVNTMISDSGGFLWVATENGLYRFLGSGFERYGTEVGLVGTDIIDLVSDGTGIMWAVSEENIYYRNGDRFEPVADKKIVLNGQHQIVVEGPESLLLIHNGQLLRMRHKHGKMVVLMAVFSPEMLKRNPVLKDLKSVNVVRGEGGAETIWLSGADRMVSIAENQIRDTERTPTLTEWNASRGLPAERWDGVLMDHAGTVWVAGQRHIAVLTKGAARFQDRSIPNANPGNLRGHAPIVEDAAGRVIAVVDCGIARWNGSFWQSIGRGNGLMHNPFITAMVFDAAGNLWLSSRGGGLYCWLGYRTLEGWGEEQGLPAPGIWALWPEKDGRMLVGTERGIAWVDPAMGTIKPLSTGAKWNYGQITALQRDEQGTLWAAALSGDILRINSHSGATVRVATLPALPFKSLQAPGQGIYYLTRKGLLGGRDYGHPQRIPAFDALAGEQRSTEAGCVSASGTTWILSENHLLRLENGLWSRPLIRGLSISTGMLLDLSCGADGSLWVTGPQTGTWRLRLEKETLQASELKLPVAFRGQAPLAIYADQHGWVWLGSDQGLLVWNGKAWRHLTQEGGLIWNDINQGVFRKGQDGSLWVGTSGGVAHLLHPEHVFDSVPLQAAIIAVHRGKQDFSLDQKLVLPWSQQPLSFQIASSTVPNRSELIFQYRLVGLQSDWIEKTDEGGNILFSALPPGNYTLMVRAFNPGLDESSGLVSMHVTILAPWWKSYWLLALGIVLLIGLLYGLERLRERQLKARHLKLERLVSERTRELEYSREQLRVQATHDGLTGMLNRRGILRAISMEIERTHRENRSMVLALVDLDLFKRVNDTYGHLAGDEAMRWFASAVGGAIRSYDHAGRYGGEEFLIALTLVPREHARQRLEALHSAISNLLVRTPECEFKVTCSIGATVVDADSGHETLEEALAVADQALYEAKAAGRNCLILRLPEEKAQEGEAIPPQKAD